jgi:hypothetical protein
VAADLAAFYRDRLRRVVLFGSFARGDVDLLVVLDRVDDEWKEFDRLLDLTWKRVLSSGRAISPYPVTPSWPKATSRTWSVPARRVKTSPGDHSEGIKAACHIAPFPLPVCLSSTSDAEQPRDRSTRQAG